MKIRQGFVSNSSSSSFCIAGVQLERSGDYETIEEKYSESGLSSYMDDYDLYVGLPVSRMKSDETRAQFEERARKLIEEVEGVEAAKNCTIFSGIVYN